MQICKQCQYTNPDGSTFCNRCGGHLGGHKNPLIDRIIGKYQLKQKIGGGGFGTVYRAEHIELGNAVAIKLLHPHLVNNEMMVERFLREARLLASLRHENIVQVIDSGNIDGLGFYLIMEWLDGKTFQWHLKEEGIPSFDQLLLIFEQLLGALDYAHRKGIVHRDLKPENLILIEGVRNRRTLKILDFGIARVVEEEKEKRLTETGLAVGTPRYMSPEQAAGEVERIDHRADLYSCGVLLVELLTGQQLFTGTTNEILLDHMDKPAPTLASLAPHMQYSPALESVVSRALVKDPEQRFQSAEQFLDALFTAFDVGPDWSPRSRSSLQVPSPRFSAPQASIAPQAPAPSLSPRHPSGAYPPSGSGLSSAARPQGFHPSAVTRALPSQSEEAAVAPPMSPLQFPDDGHGRISGGAYHGEKRNDSRVVGATPSAAKPRSSSSVSGLLWAIIGLSVGLMFVLLFFILGSLGGPPPPKYKPRLAKQGKDLLPMPPSNLDPQVPTDPPIQPGNRIPRPQRFALRLIPEPADARVFANGLRIRGDLPLQIKAPEGRRIQVVVQRTGYIPQKFFWLANKDEVREVKLKKPQPVARRRRRRKRRRRVIRRQPVYTRPLPVRRPEPAKIVYYTLSIRTIPSRASVLIDNVPKGRSPLKIRLRKGQRVKVFIKKSGYLSKNFYWTSTGNSNKKIQLPEDIYGGN